MGLETLRRQKIRFADDQMRRVRKTQGEIDSMDFGLRTWEMELPFPETEKTQSGGAGEEDKELGFGHSECEMFLDTQGEVSNW